MQGAGAGWGCVPVPPTLRPGFSGSRLGSGGLACHQCPYAQVHTRARLGRFLLVVPASHLSLLLHSPRSGPGTGNLALRGPLPPGLREPCVGRRPAEDARRGPGAPRAAGRRGRPVPASALCRAAPAVSLVGGGGVRAPTPPAPPAPPSFALSSGTGRAPLPPPFGSSFPLLPAPLAGAEPHTSVSEPNQAVSPFPEDR